MIHLFILLIEKFLIGQKLIMNMKEYYYYIFVAFIFLKFFLSGIFLTFHTIIIFLVPILYILYNKHYHIFKFEFNDTIQSILFNSLVGFAAALILIVVSGYYGNMNWVNIFTLPFNLTALLFLLSFNYELLIRYFFQNFFEKRFGKILGIILPCLVGSLIFLPDLLSASVFFIVGLFFGYFFSKTNDIYGVTIGGFIIRVVIAVLA
jgi:membrane protease YdiL (CAAX protease family)